MYTFHDIADVRAAVSRARTCGATIGYMVTTGGLHKAHAALIEELGRHAQYIVVSNMPGMDCAVSRLSVNHTTEEDAKVCRAAGANVLYAPSAPSVYGVGDPNKLFNVKALGTVSEVLEGCARPHIMSNIATHLMRMFNIVQPDVAIFGEKDYQQFAAVRQMVADLNMPITLVSMTTLRAPDGLAYASRNSKLSERERLQAPALYAAMDVIRQGIRSGRTDYLQLEREATEYLTAQGLGPDYIETRRACDLERPESTDDQLIVFGSAFLGAVRLVDTLRVNDPIEGVTVWPY